MADSFNYINSFTVSSGTTTFNCDNVFSADYDKYMISFNGIYHDIDVSNGIEGFRLINSTGGIESSTLYSYCVRYMDYGAGGGDNYSVTDRNFLFFGLYADQLSDGSGNATVYVHRPYDSATYTWFSSQAIGFNSSSGYTNTGLGVFKSAKTIRGFQLYESNAARTFGGGTIDVWGIS